MSKGRITGREAGLFDPKFDIALNLNPAQKLLGKVKNNEKNISIIQLLDKFTIGEINNFIVDVKIIGYLMLSLSSLKDVKHTHLLIDFCKYSNIAIQLQEHHLFSNGSNELKNELMLSQLTDERKMKNFPNWIKLFFDGMIEMDECVNLFKKNSTFIN